MRNRSRTIVLMVAMMLAVASGLALAQERRTDTMDLLRDKVRADKKLLVSVALELTESEAQAFWPVYGAYQSDMIEHYDRVAAFIKDYVAAHATMSDEDARQLLGRFLSLETDYTALLNRYQPRFQSALPAKKVARFYQLENKLRALLDYQLAQDIPFVK